MVLNYLLNIDERILLIESIYFFFIIKMRLLLICQNIFQPKYFVYDLFEIFFNI